jgi:tetratricopeptide (TPR) repeat protein
MSNDPEKWQWVDEDPIEKLLRPRTEEPEPAGSPAAELIASGRARFAQLQFEEAAGSFSAAAAAEPESSAAHYGLAVCLEKLEQWKPAAAAFRRALEIDPGMGNALIGLGACLLHLDADTHALQCFERRLKSDPGNIPALFGRAVALQKLGRYPLAEGAYRELFEVDASPAEALANLIGLAAARDDIQSMAEYSRHLLRINPKSKAALQGLAAAAIRAGDQKAAVEFCSRLVEVDPDSFEGRFNLRFAQQRMTEPKQGARSIA